MLLVLLKGVLWLVLWLMLRVMLWLVLLVLDVRIAIRLMGWRLSGRISVWRYKI
jgi:hypothetical protein